jgi:large subunit ribosomal protein L24e
MIAKCNFCGREQEDFKGTYLLKNDGSTSYFCSSKCMKSTLKLKRDRKRVAWTEAYKNVHSKLRKDKKN